VGQIWFPLKKKEDTRSRLLEEKQGETVDGDHQIKETKGHEVS